MDVDIGHRLLDGAADREISRPGVFRVDPALHAHLGGAALPGLLDPPLDLGKVEVIGAPAQILAELALRKGAELAPEVADVGVVDIAGHDIADDIPADPLPELVCRPANCRKGAAARREEPRDLSLAKRFSGSRPAENRCELPLTRLAPLGTLSRNAGEGGPSPEGWVGEGRRLGSGAGDP